MPYPRILEPQGGFACSPTTASLAMIAVVTTWSAVAVAQPDPRLPATPDERVDESVPYEPLPGTWQVPYLHTGERARPATVHRTLLPSTAPPRRPAGPGTLSGRADVDVITRAGEFRPPPERRASISLRDGQRVAWHASWRPWELGDWIFTGASVAVAVAGVLIPPTEDRWLARNAFDEAVRDTLRPSRQGQRNLARDASDIMLMLSINQVLVDTLVVTWWGHDADTVAYNMALMNIEAIAFNTALNQVVGGLASRERPYRVECDQLPDADLRSDCRGRKRFRSFYSGHASTAFAVAGLTCMHHSQLPLYGGGFADVLPCISSFAIAGTTGALRIVADQHWATDVLAGAAMGTFSGLAVPYLLHYGWGEPEEPQPDEISVSILPLPTGGMISGVF